MPVKCWQKARVTSSAGSRPSGTFSASAVQYDVKAGPGMEHGAAPSTRLTATTASRGPSGPHCRWVNEAATSTAFGFGFSEGAAVFLSRCSMEAHRASSSVALAYAQYVASDSWEDASARIASSKAKAAGARPPSYDLACAS